MNPSRPPFFSLALISAAALAYEILLMRLFSIIQWHHFAYMIISLALLGYGVSGTFLSLTQARLLRNFPAAYISNLCLFGIGSVSCFLMAQHIPFNVEELLWETGQLYRLFGIYLLLSLPFFFAANAIGLLFLQYRAAIPRVYATDLFGAGLGGLAIIALLFLLFPMPTLGVIGALGLLAAGSAAWELRLVSRKPVTIIAVGLLFPLYLLSAQSDLAISPYKGLSQLLRVSGTQLHSQRSSPLGWLSVVQSPKLPLRYAPGLSLNASTEPPAQLGVFTDADGMSVITQFHGDLASLSYLDETSSALPYALSKPQQVLVLGAGGGSNVLQALYHQVPHISAVEINPQLIDLLRHNYAQFSGDLYDLPNVQLHIAEARGFLADNQQSYDLIQISLLDSFNAAAAGLFALSENYLYTTEALQLYLSRLSSQAWLSITRWARIPPRDSLKLFATAIEALHRNGLTQADRQLILIRSWQTSTLLVKNGPISAREIADLQQFCRKRSFDLVYYPGIPATETNRYNILQQPYFYHGTQALLGPQSNDFITQYKFNIAPATDNQPYFFQFFKWTSLPELLELRGKGGMPLIEWGYPVLIATLLQALVTSLLLILLPLVLQRKAFSTRHAVPVRKLVFVYFFTVGLAFMFIEIAFIQRFILFLHHPLYAVAIVLTAFLAFAGWGSAWSQHHLADMPPQNRLKWVIAGIILIASLYQLLLPPLFQALMAWPVFIKMASSLLIIAPLAFLMGIPFPLALRQLGTSCPSLIPWAWGINGCASVISATFAALLAIHLGFKAVVFIGVGLYFTLLFSFPIQKKTA